MLKKILIGLVLLVVVVVIAAVVIVKMMLTPERIRENVIPLVEKQINRKLDYGDIKIGVFSGISVANLKIFEENGTDEFVSVEKMALHYRFLPLLSKRIELSEIVLDKPKISVVRLEDGSFNFSDILSPDAKTKTTTPGASGTPGTPGEADPEAKKEDTPQKPKSEKSDSGSMAVSVDDIRITDGELFFEDRSMGGTPLNYVLNQFNLKTSNFSLEESFPFDISALVNGAEFKLSGKYNLKKGDGDLALSLDALDILPFKPYFAESLPGKLDSATVTTKLDAVVKEGKLTSTGKLSVDKVNLVLNDLPDAPLENASLGFDYDILLELSKKLLSISSVHLTLNGVGASGKGSLDLLPETPVLDFTLSLKDLDLAELMQKAPAGLVKDYHEYGLGGKVTGEVTLKGAVDKGAGLLQSALLDLDHVNASLNGVPTGANGRLDYAENKLKTEGIDFHYANQHGKLTVDMDYVPGENALLTGSFAFSADKVDLNKMMAEGNAPAKTTSAQTAAAPASSSGTGASGSAPAPVPAKQANAAATEIGPLDLPLDIRGTLSVKEMLYKQLPITGAEVKLAVKNNALVIESITGQTAGGTLTGDATVNLAVKGFSYSGKMNLSETDVPKIVAGLFPEVKLHIEGKARVNANFSGTGTIPDRMMSNLQLAGKASIVEGLVKDTQIQNAIALFLGINEIKLVSFESLTSDFSMKSKLLNQNSFLNSSAIQVKSSGTVSLDGPLNLLFDTRFSPELMAKIKGPQAELTQYLTDEKGWGGFGLTVKGTMDHPKIGLDADSLRKQAEDAAKKKLKEKISEKLGGSGETGDAKKDAARDALKGIFNRSK